MFSNFIAVAGLMLVLAGLNNQAEALWPFRTTVDPALTRLDKYLRTLDIKFDDPITAKDKIVRISERLAEAEDLTGIKKLQDPNVQKLITAIKKLNLKDYCTTERFLASKELREVILADDEKALDDPKSGSLASIIDRYLWELSECIQILLFTAGRKKQKCPDLDLFDQLNGRLGDPEGYDPGSFRKDFVELRGVLRRKRELDEGRRLPFSGLEIRHALLQCKDDDDEDDEFFDEFDKIGTLFRMLERVTLDKPNALSKIKKNIITPCADFVKERGELMDPIIALALFNVNLFHRRGGYREAPRYLSCKMMLDLTEDQLDELAEGVAKASAPRNSER